MFTFLIRNEILINYYNEKTALHMAIEKDNLEIIHLLLSHTDIDINIRSVLNCFSFLYHFDQYFFIMFHISFLNGIENH